MRGGAGQLEEKGYQHTQQRQAAKDEPYTG